MTSARSRKVSNILENPMVSFVVDERDPVDPFKNRGIMVEGRARVEDYSARVYEKFGSRYSLVKVQELYRVSTEQVLVKEVVVSVTPRRMVYWTEGPNFKAIRFEPGC